MRLGCDLDRRTPIRAEKKDKKKKKNDKKKSDANKKRENTIVHGLSIRERPTPCTARDILASSALHSCATLTQT